MQSAHNSLAAPICMVRGILKQEVITTYKYGQNNALNYNKDIAAIL